MASNTNDDLDALKKDVDRLKDDIASIAAHVRGAADDAADDVTKQLRDARRKSEAAARDHIDRSRTAVESELSERPLTTLGLIFAAGLVIGRVMGK